MKAEIISEKQTSSHLFDRYRSAITPTTVSILVIIVVGLGLAFAIYQQNKADNPNGAVNSQPATPSRPLTVTPPSGNGLQPNATSGTSGLQSGSTSAPSTTNPLGNTITTPETRQNPSVNDQESLNGRDITNVR